MMKVCKVDGCNKIHFGLGYCNTHYVQFKKHGQAPYSLRTKHGLKSSPEYNVWKNFKSRCYNPNINNYMHYGGRGITVCDRWKYSFINFYNDMGKRPFLKAQIDRINNNGNYEPFNCRWTTSTENNRNKSNNVLSIKIANEIRSLYKTDKYSYKDISKIYNINKGLISRVIRNIIWN